MGICPQPPKGGFNIQDLKVPFRACLPAGRDLVAKEQLKEKVIIS
jgi:hypothetical protein